MAVVIISHPGRDVCLQIGLKRFRWWREPFDEFRRRLAASAALPPRGVLDSLAMPSYVEAVAVVRGMSLGTQLRDACRGGAFGSYFVPF